MTPEEYKAMRLAYRERWQAESRHNNERAVRRARRHLWFIGLMITLVFIIGLVMHLMNPRMGAAPTFKRLVAGRSMPFLCNRWNPKDASHPAASANPRSSVAKGKEGNATP